MVVGASTAAAGRRPTEQPPATAAGAGGAPDWLTFAEQDAACHRQEASDGHLVGYPHPHDCLTTFVFNPPPVTSRPAL